MKEVITSIEAVHDVHKPTMGVSGGFGDNVAALFGGGNFDGYRVSTTQVDEAGAFEAGREIWVLISNFQNCCEEWGYLSSDDDLEGFVGAELRGVSIVDEALNERMLSGSGLNDEWKDGGGAIFVNFVTDRGVLQLAVYNGHNGYYGHEVHIVIGDEVTVAGL